MAAIKLVNYLNTSPAKVYEALTTQKGLSETWTRECQVIPKGGSINRFGFGDEEPTLFKVTSLIPHKEITWQCIESDPEWIGTTVAFQLTEKKGKATVKLEHAGWKEETEFYSWCNYNWSFFLYSLKKYCEEGKGIPFQDRIF